MGCVLDVESHTYAVDGRKVLFSVSEVLELGGIKPPYPPSAAFYVARARELGETVHQWAEYLDNGGDDVLSLGECVALPYVTAYAKFLRDCKPEWEHIEQPFADENIEVAGTPDRIGVIPGIRGISILDIKTPRKTEKYWGIQLSAYERLTGYLGCNLLALWLQEDATYKLVPYDSHIPAFLGAVEVAKWKLRMNIR